MRIADNSMGTGIAIEREEGDSQELNVIATRIMPEWLELFAQKNRDYGSGSAYELGVRGQYSDIHRKMIKLKRAMWEGEQLNGEDADEIIKDLISHLFLTLHMFGLQREAAAAYIYTEDDAAVDAFFRMVGGDPENALKMSGVLHHPFKDMVRERAHNMLHEERVEVEASETELDEIREARIARGRKIAYDAVDAGMSVNDFEQMLANQHGDMAERLKRGTDERIEAMALEAEGAFDRPESPRRARRSPRKEDGAPGAASFAALREGRDFTVSGSYDEGGPLDRLLADEFAESDAAQNGVGYGVELKVGPARIITEQVDGRTAYFHEPYPGADREPLALVPKALIGRIQKDQYVLSKEQEAGINNLASWLDK